MTPFELNCPPPPACSSRAIHPVYVSFKVSFSSEEEQEDMFERFSNLRAVVTYLQLLDPLSFNLSDITLNLLCKGDPDTILQLNIAIVRVYLVSTILVRSFQQLPPLIAIMVRHLMSLASEPSLK